MKRHGFGALSREEQRRFASMGGKAAHAQGVARHFSSEEAREAGRLGGLKVSADREHMKKIGRIGGKKSRRGPARQTKKETLLLPNVHERETTPTLMPHVEDPEAFATAMSGGVS